MPPTSTEEPTQAGSGASPREPVAAATLARGVEVGRYVVLDRIGAGAMGVVHAAFDPRLDRKVALKLLRNPELPDEDGHRRFVREAKALAKLSHPNVVAVHDVGEYGDRLFIAMEFVEGPTLRSWLAEPRAWRTIVEVFVAAGRGLAAAHEHGLVHCDFKPDNVMIGADGRARVTDFGLARSTETPTHTPAAGTPAYMAPEQYGGEQVGARADQFALCVALYEALYGQRPFAGETIHQVSASILRGLVRRPPRGRVPKRLWRVIARGLARVPEQRWPTMHALLDALADRGARWRRAASGAVVLALVVVAAFAIDRVARARASAACQDEGEQITAVWNDEARAQASAGLLASGHPLGADAYVRAQGWLDRYAVAWAEERSRACRLRATADARTPELDARARECLDERRERMAAVVDLFGHADRPVVLRAVSIAAGLPSISACADDTALAARVSIPEAREREQQHRQRLARVRALVGGGAQGSVLAEVEALGVEADALESTALQAESRLLLGVVQLARGEAELAEHSLRAALQIAGGNGHDALAVEASTALARSTLNRASDPDDGLRWTDNAELFLTRLGSGQDELWADLFATRAAIHTTFAQFAEAEADDGRALEIRERIYGPEHPITARSLIHLGDLYLERGDLEAAGAMWDRALDVVEVTLGPEHPQVGEAFTAIGRIEFVNGRFEDALAAFERNYVILAPLEGREYAASSGASGIALSRLAMGAPREALIMMELVHEQIAALRGPTDPRAIEALIEQGRALLELDEPAEALRRFERAYALREQVFGPDHPKLARPLAYVARTRLELGDPVRALPVLAHALVLLERRKAAPEVIAMVRFATARALWIEGAERPRAVDEAKTARRLFVSAGPGWDRDVGTVETWLLATARAPETTW